MMLFYLLVAIMPLVRHSLWSEFMSGLTPTKYLGIICLGVGLFHFGSRSIPVRRFETVHARLFVLFALLTMGPFLIAGPKDSLETSP